MIRWDKERKKWRVDVGKSHEFVGRYKTHEDAQVADTAALKGYAHAKKNAQV